MPEQKPAKQRHRKVKSESKAASKSSVLDGTASTSASASAARKSSTGNSSSGSKDKKPPPAAHRLLQSLPATSVRPALGISSSSSSSNSKLKLKKHALTSTLDPLPSRISTVKNPSLRSKLTDTFVSTSQAQQSLDDYSSLLLPQAFTGLQAESELERTWKVTQRSVVAAVSQSVGSKAFSATLDGGVSALDWSRDGRFLLVAQRNGYISTLDPDTGFMLGEANVGEGIWAAKFLQNQSMHAVAQRKEVYIYDSQGIELHRMKDHIEVRYLEYLKYHWLLATIGNAGHLKYHDTSTGTLVSQHRTKSGNCQSMAQDYASALITTGAGNGTVSFWSPTSSTAHVNLLAHLGPVKAMTFDLSGRYLATAGLDAKVKVWDCRSWGVVNEFETRAPVSDLAFSQKGLLSVGWGSHVSVYRDLTQKAPGKMPKYGQAPYMQTHLPSNTVRNLQYRPYEDILTCGHSNGITNLIIPGAGEANFDSLEADPYETKSRRREREIHSLLDKLQPEMIMYPPPSHSKSDSGPSLGALNTFEKPESQKPKFSASRNGKEIPFARKPRIERLDIQDTLAPEEKVMKEVKEKKKMRGKNKTLKRHLRKKRGDIIDSASVAMRHKVQKEKEKRELQKARDRGEIVEKEPSALDRFSARR